MSLVAAVAALVAGIAPSVAAPTITVGAMYPTRGSNGPGGVDEFRGVRLAAEYVNATGGAAGSRVAVRLEPTESADQAARAVARLDDAGVPAILGSYGSTISRPAADAAQARGIVFWETGAVGELSMAAARGSKVFRFAPTGATLGAGAVSFARDRLLPLLGRDPRALRYAVTYVDDDYGRAVGLGALDEIRRSGLTLAGSFPYEIGSVRYPDLVRRIARARPDVLLVSAYLADGVEIRRETVRRRVPLVSSVGTSSSYCMHEFGVALGDDAVGLFASDKPDGHVLDPATLRPDAAAALRWARAEFRRRFDHELTAAALTGFAGAYALFRHVLPRASAATPDAIARAARTVRLPQGALPNGSGLAFDPPGELGATDNRLATSVIWQWVKPQTRAVVWPPAFATSPIVPMEL